MRKVSSRLLLGVCAAGLFFWGHSATAQQGKSGAKPADAPAQKSAPAGKNAPDWNEHAQELYHRGDWSAAEVAWKKAYELAPEDTPARAEAAFHLSSLLWEQGDYGWAKKYMAEALSTAQQLELDAEVGRLLLIKGQIEVGLGEVQKAETTFSICTKSARDQGDEVFSSLCTINRRMVRQLRGRPAGAESDYRNAIENLKKGDSPLAIGSSLTKTADIYRQTAHLEQALEILKSAQKEYEKAESLPAQRRNRLRIARVLQELGRYDEARKHLAGQIEQFRAMKNRPALVDALVLSADDAHHRGQSSEAGRLYAQALSTAKKTQSPSLVARGHLALCQFGQRMNTSAPPAQDTLAHCREAADAFKKLDAPSLVARSEAEMAAIYHNIGELNKASTRYSRAIQLLEQARLPGAEHDTDIARFRANLCQVEMSLQSRGAFFLCKKALDELGALKPPPTDMLAHTEYAAGISAGRDWQTARGVKHLENAARLASELSPPNLRLAAEANLHRGVILSEIKSRRDDATAAFNQGLKLVAANEGSDPMLTQVGAQLHTQLAQFQLRNEDFKGARNTLSAMINEKSTPTEARAWAYSGLAKAALKLGDKDTAKDALKEGLPLARELGDKELTETFEENLKKFD